MSTAVEQARGILQGIMESYGMDLIGVIQEISVMVNKEVKVVITALPGEEDAKITMTISKVEEEAE